MNEYLTIFDKNVLKKSKTGTKLSIWDKTCVVKDCDNAFRCERCVLYKTDNCSPHDFCQSSTRPDGLNVYFEDVSKAEEYANEDSVKLL